MRRLKPIGNFVHTITFDNGKEFAAHQDIAHALKAKIFFATPYHTSERGLNGTPTASSVTSSQRKQVSTILSKCRGRQGRTFVQRQASNPLASNLSPKRFSAPSLLPSNFLCTRKLNPRGFL